MKPSSLFRGPAEQTWQTAKARPVRVGVIGDTHGFLHPAVAEEFAAVSLIIHCGDIGGEKVLTALRRLAPVIAVRGNYDTEPELAADLLPDPSSLVVSGLSAVLTHRLITMDWNLNKPLFAELFLKFRPTPRLVLFGHTHFPVLERITGLWFVNPGYAGPDRREGPATAARLSIQGEEIQGEIITLGEKEGKFPGAGGRDGSS